MLNSENALTVTLPTSIRVLMPTGEVEEMKLETYLAGVVAAEIGANVPLEALKAQAVASRTYVASTRRHREYNADVCTTGHCQKWKRVDPVSAPEVFRALSETWGMIATHDDKLIDAFFFEHCDGRTRNSEEMLMPAMPYLRGVDCSCGFLTLKGHGVGMCKRGAIVMARRGASFQQILQHYYRGVAVINTAREAPVAPEVQPARAAEPAKEKSRRRARKAKEPAVRPRPVQPERAQPRPTIAAAPKPAPRPVRVARPVPTPPPLADRRRLTDDGRRMTDGRGVSASVAPARPAPAARAESKPTEPAAPVVNETPTGAAKVTEATAPAQPVVVAAELPALKEMPAQVMRRVHIDYLPGQRMIAGCLPRAGIVVAIEDAQGNKTLVFSGSAAHYGEGGFETIVDEDGLYRVSIDGEAIEVQVRGETAFIHAT